MLYAGLILLGLIILDFSLLTFMVHSYFYIGIPIFIRKFVISSKRNLEDIGLYVDRSGYLVYKIYDRDLIFRSEFSISSLRGLRCLAVIKGDIKIVNSRAIITQRINLSTIYINFLIFIFFISLGFNVVGYFYIGVILLVTLSMVFLQNRNINEVCKCIINNK
ncbi:MAG: hypothetical protein K0S76_339 [Herbinix sp.]|jgi:hypothetical protein|nr:hypothetical protein [Herbinix sp.]